jgi:GntP family gluconate:H+ symporter
MLDNPFTVLAIGMVFVVVTIVWLRIHAFLALTFAAILVGLLTSAPLGDPANVPHAVAALQTTAIEFGRTAGNIGIIIVLASIIGKCLMDSGAAETIARRFLRITGKDKAPLAMLGSGYALSIPVFFDTVFYLLIPLARALASRTGGRYAFFVMAICAGGGLTHSLVAPTPGPLIMADNLHLDLGVTVLVGILFSIPPAILGGWYLSGWISRRLDIPLRETPDMSVAELEQISHRHQNELPGFVLSTLPIILPVVLIAGASVVQAAGGGLPDRVLTAVRFAGDRNAALILSMLVAVWLLHRSRGYKLRDMAALFEPSIASAGVIILITSAGGAFGAMIRMTGIGEAIRNLAGDGASGTLLILLAFGVSSLMKIAQGSTTVAVITASALVFGMIEGVDLPYHPVYLFLAIGFGGMVFSWMNDSGFWIISRMAGLTERECLKTWSVVFASLGLIGLVEVLLLSQILPLMFLP